MRWIFFCPAIRPIVLCEHFKISAGVSGSDVRQQIQFINKLFEVAASDGAKSS